VVLLSSQLEIYCVLLPYGQYSLPPSTHTSTSLPLPLSIYSLPLPPPSPSTPFTLYTMFLGRLVYCAVLIVNAIAVLSEDRFLARSTSLVPQSIHQPTNHTNSIAVGWGRTQSDPAFGAMYDNTSVKAKSVNLIASVRTVMRSTCSPDRTRRRSCS
jgi:hypothetical protein